MSAEVRHEVNRVLVEGLDAFEQMVEQRDAALNERDHARDIAAMLEQEIAELRDALHVDDDEYVDPPGERGTAFNEGWDAGMDFVWVTVRRVLDGTE